MARLAEEKPTEFFTYPCLRPLPRRPTPRPAPRGPSALFVTSHELEIDRTIVLVYIRCTMLRVMDEYLLSLTSGDPIPCGQWLLKLTKNRWFPRGDMLTNQHSQCNIC